MDPYLEDPSLWPDVHHGLISEMQAVLNRQLRPQYHVRVEERVYISDENDPGRKAIIPDVAQKRGQEPIAKWPEGCSALLVPDPFSEPQSQARTRRIGIPVRSAALSLHCMATTILHTDFSHRSSPRDRNGHDG
jgi:hypothetical protein